MMSGDEMTGSDENDAELIVVAPEDNGLSVTRPTSKLALSLTIVDAFQTVGYRLVHV